MATAPERAIQVGSVFLHLQPFHDLLEHHRQMQRRRVLGWMVAGLRFAAHPGTVRHSFSSSMCALRSSSDKV